MFNKVIELFSGSNNLPDEEIIRMVRAGGTRRVRALHVIHDKHLYLIPVMRNKHRVLSLEQVQVAYAKTMVEIHNRILNEEKEEIESITAWFTHVLNLRCIDQVRKSPVLPIPERVEADPEDLPEPEDVQDVEADMEYEELRVLVFERLSEKERTLLLEKEYGYTNQEIADRNGYGNVRSVTVKISEAKKHFLEILDELRDNWP